MPRGFVYIMANKPRGTIYIGVTSDVLKRVYEHRNGVMEGFTKSYGCKALVYFDTADNMEAAILREKQLKNWHRHWKINLIEQHNPEWTDLYASLMDAETSSA